MGSGIQRTVMGSVTGTGSLISVTTVGFRPRHVTLLNVGDHQRGEWVEGMADDSAVKTVTAGTISLITSDGVIPLANGFSIGADSDLNAAGELIRYIAEE